MLARYFMYSQVYFHPVRRIYDVHLMDFLREQLAGGVFPTDLSLHLGTTDNEITAALFTAAFDEAKPGHLHARRIVRREHFKVLYDRNPKDVEINPEAGKAVFDAVGSEFGGDDFRHDRYHQASGAPDFPVRRRDGEIMSSLAISETLNKVPVVSIDYVFANRSILAQAGEWVRLHHTEIVKPKPEEGENG